MAPEACPECHRQNPDWKRSLKPAGFLGRRAPHTGYENLGHVPYELPRLSASKGTWRALPDPKAGRYRADSEGQIVTLGSGPHANGYALCLDCGRAEAETEEGAGAPIPSAIRQHVPLATARGMLHRLVYALIEGDLESRIDQDRAGDVLSALWTLIVSTAAVPQTVILSLREEASGRIALSANGLETGWRLQFSAGEHETMSGST